MKTNPKNTAKWKISPAQKKLLDALFKNVPIKNPHAVVDVGSGRTSIHYLAHRFKNITVTGVVYPGDLRKLKPILTCVPESNYQIAQTDIKKFKPRQKPEIALAHLFLGEATKFGHNTFPNVLKKILSIPSKYLVIVNLIRDNINYPILIKQIERTGTITALAYIRTESGDGCVGMTIKIK
ncbi:MAG: hypothetical protein WC246_03215 [Candidatus Paceibacterota bacterium]|jgi:trans-aconitate methyltransferase